MAWRVLCEDEKDIEIAFKVTAIWNEGEADEMWYGGWSSIEAESMDTFIENAKAVLLKRQTPEMTKVEVGAYIQDKLNEKYVPRVSEPPPPANINNRLVI